jgi:hypothetical protein
MGRLAAEYTLFVNVRTPLDEEILATARGWTGLIGSRPIGRL